MTLVLCLAVSAGVHVVNRLIYSLVFAYGLTSGMTSQVKSSHIKGERLDKVIALENRDVLPLNRFFSKDRRNLFCSFKLLRDMVRSQRRATCPASSAGYR